MLERALDEVSTVERCISVHRARFTKLKGGAEIASTSFFRTCIFHPCTVVLDFSILDYSTPGTWFFRTCIFIRPNWNLQKMQTWLKKTSEQMLERLVSQQNEERKWYQLLLNMDKSNMHNFKGYFPGKSWLASCTLDFTAPFITFTAT